MVEKFELTNARGISVGINNFKLMSYAPTGLGVKFNNNYNNYQTYFKLTKQSLSQGQFNAKILFGSVVSETFGSFQKFSEFLAYQPYTMTYTSDSGTWNREAMLSEMTKSEIGISSYDPNLLDESFTLEFINNWYNNKTAEYKSYDPDPNLGTYGKIYRPKYDPHVGGRNLLLNSTFTSGFTSWNNENNSWTIDSSTYQGNPIIKSPATSGYGSRIIQRFTNPPASGTQVTVSFNARGNDSNSIILVTLFNTNVVNIPLSSSFSRYTVSFTIPNNFGVPQIYFWNNVAGNNVFLNSIKVETGNVATDWTPAPEDVVAIPFGYAYAGLHG